VVHGGRALLRGAVGDPEEAARAANEAALRRERYFRDLPVVEGNPLEDLACLGRVRAVMKAGRWFVGPGVRRGEDGSNLPGPGRRLLR
jgi:hypothetical protein